MKKNDTAPISIAISGAGRIGRAVFRAYFEHRSRFPHCRLVAMNDPHDFSTLKHLLRYDSVHGKAPFDIQLSHQPDALLVNGESICLYASREPEKLPWSNHSIDCVLECTGRFKDRVGLTQHLRAGAKQVILSAPAKDALDSTIVLGANDSDLQESHQLISIGSCTTNALAPILRIAQQFQPVERCFLQLFMHIQKTSHLSTLIIVIFVVRVRRKCLSFQLGQVPQKRWLKCCLHCQVKWRDMP